MSISVTLSCTINLWKKYIIKLTKTLYKILVQLTWAQDITQENFQHFYKLCSANNLQMTHLWTCTQLNIPFCYRIKKLKKYGYKYDSILRKFSHSCSLKEKIIINSTWKIDVKKCFLNLSI